MEWMRKALGCAIACEFSVTELGGGTAARSHYRRYRAYNYLPLDGCKLSSKGIFCLLSWVIRRRVKQAKVESTDELERYIFNETLGLKC